MTDFSTWDRSTLEQFAREARDKLMENRIAIDELVGALKDAREMVSYSSSGMTHASWMTSRANDHLKRIDAAITKHTTTKEQA